MQPPSEARPTETVARPDPGLARGKWEAPAWVFWAVLAVVVASAVAYVMFRAGMIKRPAKRDESKKP